MRAVIVYNVIDTTSLQQISDRQRWRWNVDDSSSARCAPCNGYSFLPTRGGGGENMTGFSCHQGLNAYAIVSPVARDRQWRI